MSPPSNEKRFCPTYLKPIYFSKPSAAIKRSKIRNFSSVEAEQYGVAYTSSGTPCTNTTNCTGWGATNNGTNSITYAKVLLFNGTEFQDALADYNAIMMPALNLLAESAQQGMGSSEKSFIQTAESSGWITAGEYFFSLVTLNGNATAMMNQTSSSFPKQTTPFNPQTLLTVIDPSICTSSTSLMCAVFGQNNTPITNLLILIQGPVSPSTQAVS